MHTEEATNSFLMEIWGLFTFSMGHFLTQGVWLDTKQAVPIATPTTLLAEKEHCLFFFNSLLSPLRKTSKPKIYLNAQFQENLFG